jgi:hypothetical protein
MRMSALYLSCMQCCDRFQVPRLTSNVLSQCGTAVSMRFGHEELMTLKIGFSDHLSYSCHCRLIGALKMIHALHAAYRAV